MSYFKRPLLYINSTAKADQPKKEGKMAKICNPQTRSLVIHYGAKMLGSLVPGPLFFRKDI